MFQPILQVFEIPHDLSAWVLSVAKIWKSQYRNNASACHFVLQELGNHLLQNDLLWCDFHRYIQNQLNDSRKTWLWNASHSALDTCIQSPRHSQNKYMRACTHTHRQGSTYYIAYSEAILQPKIIWRLCCIEIYKWHSSIKILYSEHSLTNVCNY